MLKKESADHADKAGSDGVGSVPDGLLGCKLGRLDPMTHKADARWHTHTLEIPVENPQGTDDVNQRHCSLALGVKHIHERVHGRTEADCQVGDGGQHKAKGHKFPPAEPVRQKTVDETRDSVDYAI